MSIKLRRIIMSLALSGAVMISPLSAMDSMDSKDEESEKPGSLLAETSFSLEKYQQESDDFLNSSITENREVSNDQITNEEYLTNINFPREVRFRIFFNQSLEVLYSFAQTCKLAYSFCVSKEVNQNIISPQVNEIIQANNNFRYQALVRGAGMIERALSPQISLFHIKGLTNAGCLGDGNACLVLAEMDWSAPHLQGKLNHRDGWYNRALKFFPVTTKEANAIFLGKAHHQIKQYPNIPGTSIQYKNLESAAKSLQCMTDGLLFQFAGITQCVMQMIWNGQYVRIDDSSQANVAVIQRPRTSQEKRRDFSLVSSLAQHAVKLGINDLNTIGMFGHAPMNNLPHGMHMPQNMAMMFNQFGFALMNPKQNQIFLDNGHFDLFMPN